MKNQSRSNMFFKNITVFNLKQTIDPTTLDAALSQFSFKPCGNLQASSNGWVHPLVKDHETLCHHSNHFHLLCLKTEEKILPAQVINEHTADKVAEIETLQNTTVGKHEKTAIKEDIAHQLLSKAFSRNKTTYAYLDTLNHYLVIDATADKAIDDITMLLRKSLGSLKIEPLLENISGVITHWFKHGTAPQDIVIEDKCKLITDQGDGVATITCQGNTMLSDNIIAFIDSGGVIAELAIAWRDQLSMTMNDRFQFKSIKFLEGIKNLNAELSKADPLVKAEADFLLMAESFADFIRSMYEFCNHSEKETVDLFEGSQSEEKTPCL